MFDFSNFIKPVFLLFFGLLVTSVYSQETFRDEFRSVSYSNNHGELDWATDWIERGDSDLGPSSDEISISSSTRRLRFRAIAGARIQRTADLTGATTAILSFDWQTSSLGGDRKLLVLVSNNGGANFTTIGTLTGGSSYGTFTYDISAYISPNTTIGFRQSRLNWQNVDNAFIDNFQISADIPPTLSIEDVSVSESENSVTFMVRHNLIDASGSFDVEYTTLDGSATAGNDYVFKNDIISFGGSVGDTAQIAIDILDDFVFEGDELFSIQFLNTTDSSVDISDTATGTIVENDNDPNATRPYEERFTANLQGNFTMYGNTNLTCIANCSGATSNNAPVVMTYADIDSDATTLNSSNSTISLPTGAHVVWAGLYWGGVYESGESGTTDPPASLNIDEVKLKIPGSGVYTSITSEIRNVESSQFAGWKTFMAYAEVTPLLTAGGNGVYYVADIALVTGSSVIGPHGGWSIVVVYEDPSDKIRNVSVWDGFEYFGNGSNDTFAINGLLTPSTGSFETHVGYYAMDGDADQTGDYLNLNGNPINNTLNAGNNVLNGTLSEFDVDVGNRNPNLAYNYGVDVDVFDASGMVPNSASQVQVDIGSTGEEIWGGAFAISNEVALPSISGKAFSQNSIFVGEETTVTITIENPSDGAVLTNFTLTDSLPEDMVISSTPDAVSPCGGSITANPDGRSFTISGLTLTPGNTCQLFFDVVAKGYGMYNNTVSPSDTSNDQGIPVLGQASDQLTVRVRNVITNRRITYRVKRD